MRPRACNDLTQCIADVEYAMARKPSLTNLPNAERIAEVVPNLRHFRHDPPDDGPTLLLMPHSSVTLSSDFLSFLLYL